MVSERDNSKITRIEEKLDKVLDILNQERLEIARNTNCLFGNGQRGLVERVEELEDTQEKHTRYFWLINIIYTSIASVCVFIINKIWK